jgi:hypothetical protein
MWIVFQLCVPTLLWRIIVSTDAQYKPVSFFTSIAILISNILPKTIVLLCSRRLEESAGRIHGKYLPLVLAYEILPCIFRSHSFLWTVPDLANSLRMYCHLKRFAIGNQRVVPLERSGYKMGPITVVFTYVPSRRMSRELCIPIF